MCFDMDGRGMSRQNRAFMGSAVLGISFVQLIFGLVALAAQIGYYYFCEWDAVCLVLPAFVPIILFIIASIIGIFAGIEKTDTLIMTCLVFGIIIIIGTPVSVGLWGLDGLGLKPFSLTPNAMQNELNTAITWGLLLIPIIHWILFIVVVILCSIAVCCPEECGRMGGYPQKHRVIYATTGGYGTHQQLTPTYQASTVIAAPVPTIQEECGRMGGYPQKPQVVYATGGGYGTHQQLTPTYQASNIIAPAPQMQTVQTIQVPVKPACTQYRVVQVPQQGIQQASLNIF